ncbi:SPOR domain-containing protein [Pararhodobacter aggregans]|uniref:SPOR domain-containing protein n=1 Tax=Pararhodobacter aggregans TaxID=404875 RepID=A0A2T7UNG6_9RHOB|nr:SPOR domain-containing protein [Pararhodobacter aggregans]PTW98838.1 sporulation related protein [Pararhodobacter aggregans]PVE46161.1 SPOR domain-containing protein [Pararhodobacter aggregans]
MGRDFTKAIPRPAATSVVALSLVLALGACQMSQTTAEGAPVTASAPAASGPGQRVIERDVEAPEVFEMQEPGLWDGRPSLGGVWVAHPTARDPERVMIRNTRTGATVIGALFRRERENPGPRFQVSSEAANALGILAGAPTEIQVTALRLQRVEMEIDPEPATAATETLALAPVEAPTATATVAAPMAPPQGQVAIIDEPQPRRRLRDLFRSDDTPPATTPIAQTALAPAAGAATAAPAAVAAAVPPASAPAIIPTEPPRRTLRDLFRRRQPAPDTTLIPLPDASSGPAAATQPLQATGTQPLPATATAPAAPTPRIDRPFVQIGIFSVEQNAANARAQMIAAGLGAEIRRGRVGENDFWRVVVGPATSTAERGQFLQRVRGLGFADAYAVQR